VILALLLILPFGVIQVLPLAHADGSVFSIAKGDGSSYNNLPNNSPEIVNSGVSDVQYDNYGDAGGMISTSNNGNPILQVWYFETFTYSPPNCSSSQCQDLHLYMNYFLNAFVYSPGCSGTWLLAQYGMATGAINSHTQISPQMPLPMTNYEYDYPGNCQPNSNCGSVCVFAADQAKTIDSDATGIGNGCASGCGNCPGSFCNFVAGATYTFVLLFEITAIQSSSVTYDSGGTSGQGAAYLYPGYYGSDSDFTSGNFCTVLSYQSSPITGCPSPTCPPSCATLSATITVQQQMTFSFDFIGSASGGLSPYSYRWDYGDGQTDWGQTVYHTYCCGQTYLVTLTVYDSQSPQHTATVQKYVVSGSWGPY